MRRTVVVLALMLGLWPAGDAAAQDQDPTLRDRPSETDKQKLDRLAAWMEAMRDRPRDSILTHDPMGKARALAGDVALPPELLAIAGNDEDVRAAAREVLLAHLATAKAELESRKWDLEEHRNVYTVTNRISHAAAVVVHLIVAVTLWAAISEFRHAQRRRKAVGDQVTEIAIGADKIAVKTALHGLLLLTVGFAFYFLYVKFIYPIT